MNGKEIKDYPSYSITEDGQVWSYRRKKPKKLKPQSATQSGRYQQVRLFNIRYPKGRLQYVHRLVYETYIGKIDDDKTVDHIDSNTYNNHYSNLQQLTQSDNSFKANKHKVKLVNEKDEIRRLYHEEGWSQKQIAKHYDCSSTHIWRIINKKRHCMKNGKWVTKEMRD